MHIRNGHIRIALTAVAIAIFIYALTTGRYELPVELSALTLGLVIIWLWPLVALLDRFEVRQLEKFKVTCMIVGAGLLLAGGILLALYPQQEVAQFLQH